MILFQVGLALRFDVVTSEDRLVLVVEDDQAIRDVMVDVLEEHGFGVVCASNGAEALRHLDRVRPDVMVLDLLMPVMHGWAFMEAYADKTDGASIPIVVVSVNPALPRSFDRLGVRQVIAKPFNFDDLVEAVEHAAKPAAA